MSFQRAVLLIASMILIGACTPPVRPPAKAVPTETLKVNPELVKNKMEGQLK